MCEKYARELKFVLEIEQFDINEYEIRHGMLISYCETALEYME